MPKRSATSSARRKRPRLTYFTDYCLTGVVTEKLRSAGWGVETLFDHFPMDTHDIDWLPFIGRKKWILLTKDNRMKGRYLELMSMMNSKVRAFVLESRNSLSGPEIADIFLKAKGKIESILATQSAPFVARIRAGDGSIDVRIDSDTSPEIKKLILKNTQRRK